MRHSGRILSVAGSTSDRRRRSLENAETALRRSKRDIPENPCMRGEPKRTTILFGLDAETGEVLELFQNPGKTKISNLVEKIFWKTFDLHTKVVANRYTKNT